MLNRFTDSKASLVIAADADRSGQAKRVAQADTRNVALCSPVEVEEKEMRRNFASLSKLLICGLVVLPLAAIDGAGAATYTTLHHFKLKNGGLYPAAGLLVDQSGNLYGTTSEGGNGQNCGQSGCGVVFKLAPDGSEAILYSFAGGADGSAPETTLIADQTGNLYGTTTGGGGNGCQFGTGCGTIFKLAPDGTETVLHAFQGKNGDGAFPVGDLLLDEVGNLYGTTVQGGNIKCGGTGCGTVFVLAPDGTETALHVFQGGKDGVGPGAGMIADEAGNLYGVTAQGGGSGCSGAGCGIIFELAPDGTETILHAFTGGKHDGAVPEGTLILDSSGNLFGTTIGGGGISPRRCFGFGCGTIFKLAPNETLTVLYAFDGHDGVAPQGTMIRDQAGNLYGTTYAGGHGYSGRGLDKACYPNGGCGLIFELAADGTETTLHKMSGKSGGRTPSPGLAVDQAGDLYGTTEFGGSKTCFEGCGIVFKISP